jgi:hypothetical protein
MSTDSSEAAHRAANVDRMAAVEGFDVVIVCTGSLQQAQYWQSRLEAGVGAVLPQGSKVLAVTEDWPGGAGNALGTLFAWQNAAALAKEKFGLDLAAQLAAGAISVGMFHTAGKGTRLAPLPGSESNNKPGVKLPATLTLADGSTALLTILEAVIKQTGLYGRSRKGRLSVFWGDQVFIPSAAVDYTPTAHADLLCTLAPMPDAEQWAARGLDKYGLIAVGASGSAAQVEKVDHATALRMLAALQPIASVGTSLGSFSVSAPLLEVLLSEFSSELRARTGKLDTDPHLWMPLTLSLPAYTELMGQKGVSAESAAAHHARMQQVLAKLQARPDGASLSLFGAVDIGAAAYWWDYGQLPLYLKNCLLMSEQSSEEAALLRRFAGVLQAAVAADGSIVSGCELNSSGSGSSDSSGSGSSSSGVQGGAALACVRCCDVQAEVSIDKTSTV